MARKSKLEINARDARWRCDTSIFKFETTDEIPCCGDIIGQERAINAIKLGLEVSTPGYNIYVSGLTGTGRSTTIMRLLRNMKLKKKDLLDICYVHNFKTSEMPICVMLPAGKALRFKKHMAHMFETLKTHIPQAFEGEQFKNEQKAILEDFKQKKNEIVSEFETIIAEKGFSLFEVQYGPFTRPEIMPIIGEETVAMDKLPALVEEGKITSQKAEQIEEDRDALMEKMEHFIKQSRAMDVALTESMIELEKRMVSPMILMCVREVRDKFDYEKVRTYLKNLEDYIIENLNLFKEPPPGEEEQAQAKERILEFDVNVIVDNSATEGVPVIVEKSPRYTNLFGTIERSFDSKEEGKSDFTKIRAGSMIRANGGFLVLNLTDIVEEPAVWPALKRALKNQQISIQGLDSFFMMPTSVIKPEPIDLDVKVVLLGDAYTYQMLYNYDEEFKKIFKVKADFDNVMPNNSENLHKYAQFIRNLTNEEKLRPFHKAAVGSVIEEGTRLAGHTTKLSTMFSDIADVIREADYWAEKEEMSTVDRRHVEKAIQERISRVNLIEEKIKEMIHEGVILLDVKDSVVGQINGLSVYDLGDYAFGKPSRITAETALGREGVINIEREADLSGKTHNKGMLILEGYLRRQYAQDKPLTMSASICFEQSYGGIDGDSASSTEIYALLSSLSGAALRQDIAVTGSVNQKGEIQPIGGVNEKIEGFFDICKVSGFTGSQGVMIPSLNRRDLMLRHDVVEAIGNGTFHIHAIKTIDEGIEILTGVKAGKPLPSGGFQKGSIHDLVDKKLRAFADQIREFYDLGE